MRVAVLLLNHDQWELTRMCLDSLYRSEGGVEILPLLIDNDSVSEPPAWLSDYPGLRFRKLSENTGFATGNNRAFELMEPGEAPYTFILNNDATVEPGTVARLAGFLEREPRAGITTPAVFFASKPDTVWSAGARFRPSRMIYNQRFWPDRKSLPESPVRTIFATGCATMVRTELYRKLGGYRDEFFMYFEDSDLGIRVMREGYDIWLIPDAGVYHHVSVSAGGVLSPFAIYYSLRNRIVLGNEILPLRHRLAFYAYLAGMVGSKTLVYPLKGKSALVPSMWKAVFDGFTRRLGARFAAAKPLGVRPGGSPGQESGETAESR